MDIIKQLKEEHVAIGYAFEDIKKSIDDKKVEDHTLANNFREMTNALVNHLELEDNIIYPALAHCKNQERRTIGKNFSKEMLGISKTVLQFFKKYENVNISELKKDTTFKKTLTVIIKALKKRIKIEEEILFPTYQKCSK